MSADDQDRAGDLLIQEVDDDLRREQYQRLWQQYGKYAIAAVVAVVLSVAGREGWRQWHDRAFQRDAAQFAAAEDLTAAGDKAGAMTKLAEIAKDQQGGFAVAAAMQRAELQAESGDQAGAIATYDSLAQSAVPALFKDLATLKSAMLSMDGADPEILARKLQPLTGQANPWHSTAQELLAVLAARRGDAAGASAIYKQIADDAQAPQAMRARAAEMLALSGSEPAAAPMPATK